MEHKPTKFHWFLLKAKPRLLYAAFVGFLTFFFLEGHHFSTRFLMAWSAASLTYLILVFIMMQYFNRKKNIVKACEPYGQKKYQIFRTEKFDINNIPGIIFVIKKIILYCYSSFIIHCIVYGFRLIINFIC